MANRISKLLGAFKNADKIFEGVKNKTFKKDHIEAVAASRNEICLNCSFYDNIGTNCAVPKTQPCCSDCGCSLEFKLRSLSSECPKEYWSSVTSEEEEELITKQIKDNETNN